MTIMPIISRQLVTLAIEAWAGNCWLRLRLAFILHSINMVVLSVVGFSCMMKIYADAPSLAFIRNDHLLDMLEGEGIE